MKKCALAMMAAAVAEAQRSDQEIIPEFVAAQYSCNAEFPGWQSKISPKNWEPILEAFVNRLNLLKEGNFSATKDRKALAKA